MADKIIEVSDSVTRSETITSSDKEKITTNE